MNPDETDETEPLVETAMQLCEVCDDYNRNVFRQSLEYLTPEDCKVVFEDFRKAVKDGHVINKAAYLNSLLQKFLRDLDKLTGLENEIREARNRATGPDAPFCARNLSPNAIKFGFLAHLYEIARAEKSESLQLAVFKAGVETLLLGKLYSFRSSSSDGTPLRPEDETARKIFNRLKPLAEKESLDGKTIEEWSKRLAFYFSKRIAQRYGQPLTLEEAVK